MNRHYQYQVLRFVNAKITTELVSRHTTKQHAVKAASKANRERFKGNDPVNCYHVVRPLN